MPDSAVGNGVELWFQTDNFSGSLAQIQESGAHILAGPLLNENAIHREVWIRDPDGYVVVVAGKYGDYVSV